MSGIKVSRHINTKRVLRYRAKTGDNDCNVNSSRYSLSTALCKSIRYQAKSEQNVRQDLIPRGATWRHTRHSEAMLQPKCNFTR